MFPQVAGETVWCPRPGRERLPLPSTVRFVRKTGLMKLCGMEKWKCFQRCLDWGIEKIEKHGDVLKHHFKPEHWLTETDMDKFHNTRTHVHAIPSNQLNMIAKYKVNYILAWFAFILSVGMDTWNYFSYSASAWNLTVTCFAWKHFITYWYCKILLFFQTNMGCRSVILAHLASHQNYSSNFLFYSLSVNT